MKELFPIEESLSPKLAWLREHHVTTFLSMPDHPEARLWMAGVNPKGLPPYNFFAEETAANGNMLIGEGDTEDEAILELCEKTGLPHYSLEP